MFNQYVIPTVINEIKETIHFTYRTAKRVAVGVIGGTILLLGIAMVVLPGPAFIVIPTGLAILSIEFAWARHWLHKVRERIANEVDKRRNNRSRYR